MTNLQTIIYLGSRGADFKHMIRGLLKRGKLKPKYIDLLTDEKSMIQYGYAFTASSADSVNNYERFEQNGDLTANKFIVSYAYKRFPQIDCTAGVKIAARLRINYGSANFFAPLGESLGFWDYISAAEEGNMKGMKYRKTKKKALLEDCVESFIGCTEYLLDKAYCVGVGYGIVYDILTDIFNKIQISIKFEDLYDSVTRLKETFDSMKHIGTWQYINIREDIEGGHSITKSTVYQIPLGMQTAPFNRKIAPDKFVKEPRTGWIEIGTGFASNQDDAQKKAAENGIETLRQRGIYKVPPPEYKYFCEQ